MPIPGSPNAPFFKGKNVTDFLDTLEALASTSQVLLDDLPHYVLRYCHRRVRDVVEFAPCWTQNDWPAAHAYLIKLYGSSDRKPHVSADKFRKWIKHHSREETFNSLQDVDKYYRDFTAQIAPLRTQFITSIEADLLFFRGIPRELQPNIRDQLPEAQTKVHSPPPMDDVLALLRKEFDEDDILDKDDMDIASDSEESDLDLSKSDYNKTTRKSKRKVKSANDMESDFTRGKLPEKPTDIEFGSPPPPSTLPRFFNQALHVFSPYSIQQEVQQESTPIFSEKRVQLTPQTPPGLSLPSKSQVSPPQERPPVTVSRQSLQQSRIRIEAVPQTEPPLTRPHQTTYAPGFRPPSVQRTTPTTAQHMLHPANTEDVSKSRAWKVTPEDKVTVQKVLEQDKDLRDTSKQAKAPGVYHFTSTVQDEVDGDVQAEILDTLTTLPLKEIIGTSADLQKRIADLTRTRREYMTTATITESMDDTCGAESAYIEELYSDGDFGEETENAKPTYSTAHLPNTGKEEVLLWYSLGTEKLEAPIAPDSSLNDCYNVATQGDECKDDSDTNACFAVVKCFVRRVEKHQNIYFPCHLKFLATDDITFKNLFYCTSSLVVPKDFPFHCRFNSQQTDDTLSRIAFHAVPTTLKAIEPVPLQDIEACYTRPTRFKPVRFKSRPSFTSICAHGHSNNDLKIIKITQPRRLLPEPPPSSSNKRFVNQVKGDENDHLLTLLSFFLVEYLLFLKHLLQTDNVLFRTFFDANQEIELREDFSYCPRFYSLFTDYFIFKAVVYLAFRRIFPQNNHKARKAKSDGLRLILQVTKPDEDSRLPQKQFATTRTRPPFTKETTKITFTRVMEDVLFNRSNSAHTPQVFVSSIVDTRHLGADHKEYTTTTTHPGFLTKLTTLGLGQDKRKGFSYFAQTFTYFSRQRKRSTAITYSICETNEASPSKRTYKCMQRLARICELPPWPNYSVRGLALAYKTQRRRLPIATINACQSTVGFDEKLLKLITWQQEKGGLRLFNSLLRHTLVTSKSGSSPYFIQHLSVSIRSLTCFLRRCEVFEECRLGIDLLQGFANEAVITLDTTFLQHLKIPWRQMLGDDVHHVTNQTSQDSSREVFRVLDSQFVQVFKDLRHRASQVYFCFEVDANVLLDLIGFSSLCVYSLFVLTLFVSSACMMRASCEVSPTCGRAGKPARQPSPFGNIHSRPPSCHQEFIY